jgi:hypothetical protein
MANPFDHMDSFQSLDPDTKDQITSKFNSMSPEDQQMIMSKANTPMQNRGLEPGAQDISLTPLTKGEFQKTGEDVSAKMMTKGMINANIDPYLAATVGTTIAMIPHIVASLVGPKGAKTASEGASAITEAVAESPIAKAIMGTGTKEVAALTEKVAELPIRQVSKMTMAQGVKTAAKQGIQSAEESAGLGIDQLGAGSAFQKIVSNKEQLSAFAERAARITDMGAEKLAGSMDSRTLQTMRKVAQEGLKNGGENINDLSRVQLSKAKKVFSDALEMQQPELKDALSKYRDIEKVIQDLPARFKQEKQTLTLALVKARNLAASQAPIRKGAAIVAGGALAGGGAYEMRKALGQ